MNKYIISVRNTANGKYENVEVTEEVYRAYMRTGWNIKDNDESFFKHQICKKYLQNKKSSAIIVNN